VDVVVVSYNSEEHLRRCVQPLAWLAGVTVIVVDSASSDGSVERVADLPVTRIPLTENRGFAHGCNVGWRAGEAEFVLFLNPDATIDEESLRRLLRGAVEDEQVGLVAPRIVKPDGALDYSLRRFPRLRSTYAVALFLHRLFPRATWSDELVRDPAAYRSSSKPEWVSGACMLVRRALLEQLEGLDEGFFLYSEDIDLCRRIRDAGCEVVFEPAAVAVHYGGASAPRASLLPILARSRVRYARKHEPPTSAFLEQLGVALGELTRSLVSRGGAAARRGHIRAAAAALRPSARAGRPSS
jgi:N-acetylglucosaminyl-diphospho-decaprenol L-rhamnosyltransferase